jgi:RNA polymerase sigma-70 factor, ECF subfamily
LTAREGPSERARRARSWHGDPEARWRVDQLGARDGATEKGAELIEMTRPKPKPRAPPLGPPRGAVPSAGSRDADARAAAARVARESYGKLVAYLAASSRDVPRAEDALADAFASALAVWPNQGVPFNPEGWLAKAARRRLIDAARRRRSAERASETLELIDAELKEAAEARLTIPDRRLALMFACAHPAIEESVRAPLMLQTILGLDAAAIASAFLVSPAAMGQRLARAKAKIRLAGVPFKIPEREDLPQRLGVALEAIYAAFSFAWAEAFSDDPRGRNLAEEAIWLGRVLVTLAPDEPEAMGLLALMLYAHARREARRDPLGRYVPLSEQAVERWSQGAIEEAEALLNAAGALGAPGRFQLEAAVQSVHAARRLTGTTDWEAIALLYDALFALTGSPVVAVNRAVAVAQARGAAAGLKLLDEVGPEGGLAGFEPFWVARANLCAKLGDVDEARRAFCLAIGLETDPAARAFLIARLAALA